MNTPSKRALLVLATGAGVLALYFAAYFGSVSVRFRHNRAYKLWTMQEAFPHYTVGPFPQVLGQWFFKPAHTADELYFRPRLWDDRREALTNGLSQ
jgi:hypothetical protein